MPEKVVATAQMAGPDTTRVMMQIQVTALVRRLECMNWRLIPRQRSNVFPDAPFVIEIVIAKNETLASGEHMETMTHVLGIAANGEVAKNVEDVIFANALLDSPHNSDVHLFDDREIARVGAMLANIGMAEMQIGGVEFTREGHRKTPRIGIASGTARRRMSGCGYRYSEYLRH
ncbi:hypothetical protein ACTJK5_10550 [Agrobacterium sp. 22094]|uniref:hypothetical protein n=1 Tax=Agrobacterium sp. 22094 TaxID=3453872 RepID=UPI003F875A93